MGELYFKPKVGGEWKPLEVIGDPLELRECQGSHTAMTPMEFSFAATIELTKGMRRLFEKIERNQKIHERRVLRKWQERWHKNHTAWVTR